MSYGTGMVYVIRTKGKSQASFMTHSPPGRTEAFLDAKRFRWAAEAGKFLWDYRIRNPGEKWEVVRYEVDWKETVGVSEQALSALVKNERAER